MSEPQKMVHLTPAQRYRKKFSHPLTDAAPPQLSEAELRVALAMYLNPPRIMAGLMAKEKLMVSFFRLLRSTVARYNYHWIVCRRFIPEMVSAGNEAIVDTILKLTPEQVRGDNKSQALGGLIESAIRHSVETTINDLRGVLPASERTNRSRESDDRRPIYGSIEINLTNPRVKNLKAYLDPSLFRIDVEDAIAVIAKSSIEKAVCARSNWGLSNREIAKKLNISPQHVGRVRTTLRQRYQELGERHA